MTVEKRDVAFLTHLAMRIRQDTYGAGPWDEPGTAKVIGELVGRSLLITVEHVIRNAADPKAKTPGVLRGSYTPAPPPVEHIGRGLRRTDQCARCGGRKGACHCTREHLVADYEPPAPVEALTPREESIQAARAALRKESHDQ